MFALLRVVRFLCKRRAFSGRPPCGVAFGSHFYFPASVISPFRPTFTLMLPKLRHGFYSGFCCWNQFLASRFMVVWFSPSRRSPGTSDGLSQLRRLSRAGPYSILLGFHEDSSLISHDEQRRCQYNQCRCEP